MRQSRLIAHLKEHTNLLDDPFVVVDVGCSMGLEPGLRQFEPNLAGLGVDPLLSEIERLSEAESNPNIHYEAAWIAPEDGEASSCPVRNGWRVRSSSYAVVGSEPS